MKPSQGKKLILSAAKEIFPSILPCQLQDARQAILSHLGMSKENFGFFPNGSSKFDNYCSQVVKSLKETGEMKTSGWEWSWVGGQPETLQMVIQESSEEESFDDLFAELEDEVEVKKQPSLYNLSCEETLIRLVAITTCFGKVVKSDTECQSCPLFELCLEKAGESKLAKKAKKEEKLEALGQALQAGYDLKGVKPPKSARFHEAQEVNCSHPLPCVVSGEILGEGEAIVHIPSWGMMKKVIAETFITIYS